MSNEKLMNTEEAIEILLKYIEHECNKSEVTMTIEDIVEFTQIMGLLKQGEKTVAMHKEIGEIFEHNHMTCIDRDLWNELKQKYFPIITKVKDEKKNQI